VGTFFQKGPDPPEAKVVEKGTGENLAKIYIVVPLFPYVSFPFFDIMKRK